MRGAVGSSFMATGPGADQGAKKGVKLRVRRPGPSPRCLHVVQMLPAIDPPTAALVAGVVVFLALASVVGWVLGRRVAADPAATPARRATIGNLNARLRSWWVLVGACAVALAGGRVGAAALFGLASFWALREFLALGPSGPPADDRPTFWACFVVTPLQYVLAAAPWAGGLFGTLIPVYALLLIPLRMAMTGDCNGFLGRAARVQWGLMVCVYGVSHAPALMSLAVPGGGGARLLPWFLLVVQLSDVLQYVWGKLAGRHPVAPRVSPGKTWEGLIGGVGSATAVGTALWWATPFTPWQAAGMSLAITLSGFAGGLVLSAVKRDRGVKDFGTLIEGHGGVLDRIDSICFAAPVFFHLTRGLFT